MAYTDEQIIAAVQRYAQEHGALNGQKSWDRWAQGQTGVPKGSALDKRGGFPFWAERAGVPFVRPVNTPQEATRQALIDAAQRYAASHNGTLCGGTVWRRWADAERAAGRTVPSYKALYAHFGSIQALAAAAGVTYAPQVGGGWESGRPRAKPKPKPTRAPHVRKPSQRKPKTPRRNHAMQEFVQFHLSRIAAIPPLDDDQRERIRQRIEAELARLKGATP